MPVIETEKGKENIKFASCIMSKGKEKEKKKMWSNSSFFGKERKRKREMDFFFTDYELILLCRS